MRNLIIALAFMLMGGNLFAGESLVKETLFSVDYESINLLQNDVDANTSVEYIWDDAFGLCITRIHVYDADDNYLRTDVWYSSASSQEQCNVNSLQTLLRWY